MKELKNKLESGGQKIAMLGDAILACEFGGRVLALAPDNETNLLWVNPVAVSRAQIASWRDSKKWTNIGGDRAWLAPEVDTNLRGAKEFMILGRTPELREFSAAYMVPSEIDPANYSMKSTDGCIDLTTSMEVHWLRSGEKLALEVTRVVKPILHPPVDVPSEVSFAGYYLESRLTSKGPRYSATPSIWNLLQVPAGGTITAAVQPGCRPTTWVGSPQWTATSREVTSDVNAKKSFKWSLLASQCRGRLLNFRSLDGERAGLLVRNFPVHADAAYADCPPRAQQDTGHVCQVYIDDGALGGFGEMEFHTPALRADETSNNIIASTWGFIGPQKKIHDLYEELVR